MSLTMVAPRMPELAVTAGSGSVPSTPDSLGILFVEDNPVDALVVSELLRAASGGTSIRMHIVASLKAMLETYTPRQHDVVMVDLTLPDASGLQAVRTILDHDPDVAVVVITATNDEQLGDQALRMGAQDYLTKGGLTGQALRRVVRYARARKAAVRDSEERYRRILESALDAVVITDASGAIVDWNARAEAMFGWSRTEAVGLKLAETIFKGTHGQGGRECDALNSVRETTARRRDGKTFPVEVAVSATGTSGNRLYTAFIRDITSRRAMEAQLVHAQKMDGIGRLAGGVAHDFNNMLAAVISFSELLLMDSAEDDPRRADVQTIHEAAMRATGLTRQLLAFSRRQVFTPKVTDMNGLLAGVDRMLRRLIGSDVELVTLFGEHLGQVEVDQGQIESAIVNLVVNARDAMPQGGTLTVETANVTLAPAANEIAPGAIKGPAVRITVTDTGHGMDEATMAQVFEPFFTTKESGKGTGLGLASVYGIVKQSGGQVSVSSAPGRGACFTIDLPMVRGTADAGAEHSKTAIPGGTETILVAEDNALVRRGIAATLSARGYKVLQAVNGEEAVRIAEQHDAPIHMLLADVVMPMMPAQELCDRLVALRPDVRVIFMSGYMNESVRSSNARVMDFVQKPFTSEVLARKVRAILDKEI